MPATWWEALVRTGFESRWGWISVAVPVPYLAMLKSLTGLPRDLSEQTQPTTRLACSNGLECYRLGNDCIQFKLSHKPGLAGLNRGVWRYNKRNFTYVLLCVETGVKLFLIHFYSSDFWSIYYYTVLVCYWKWTRLSRCKDSVGKSQMAKGNECFTARSFTKMSLNNTILKGILECYSYILTHKLSEKKNPKNTTELNGCTIMNYQVHNCVLNSKLPLLFPQTPKSHSTVCYNC